MNKKIIIIAGIIVVLAVAITAAISIINYNNKNGTYMATRTVTKEWSSFFTSSEWNFHYPKGRVEKEVAYLKFENDKLVSCIGMDVITFDNILDAQYFYDTAVENVGLPIDNLKTTMISKGDDIFDTVGNYIVTLEGEQNVWAFRKKSKQEVVEYFIELGCVISKIRNIN